MAGGSGPGDIGGPSVRAIAEAPRLLPSGDEAGTPPGDRAFRPDVEGLRAVAILLVVLFHAGVSQLPGGYVGVDVFFVVSGYVITGVLLRERATTGTTSLLGFYARRARRILPAVTLVLITIVVAAWILGTASALQTADDAKWAALFLANFHFAAAGTNYFSAQLPPSPLQNLWTLSVEEQFYVVYPTLFLLVAGLGLRLHLRTKMLAAMGLVVIISFGWSVIQTGSNPNAAYFSPLTRAWELALGAIVALVAPHFARVPSAVAAIVTWAGLTAILVAAIVYNAQTPYPSVYAALPVCGAAMVIAAGTANPKFGVERLLGTLPFRQLGRLSYSLYLWHWPILILAAESQGRESLPLSSNLGWLLVALGASIVTYWVVENPIRHSSWLRRRSVASIGMGAAFVVATLLVSTVESAVTTPAVATLNMPPVTSTPSLAAIEDLVRAAPAIKSVPIHLVPPLQSRDFGNPTQVACQPVGYVATTMKPCRFGDPHGERTMVLYGDSHSDMWFRTVDEIAEAAHWKLWYLGKEACPVELLPMVRPGNGQSGEYSQCDQWHSYAIDEINRLRPNVVIVSQEYHDAPGARSYSGDQWRSGLVKFFSSITVPGVRFDVIGNIPQLPNDPAQCLDANPDDVQACSAPTAKSLNPYGKAEEQAVQSVGGHYVDVIPWFCSAICTAVIGNYQIYLDQAHLMGSYAILLGGVLTQALQLPVSGDTAWRVFPEVVLPKRGSALKGTVVLAAGSKSGGFGKDAKVSFILSGNGQRSLVIADGQPTLVGWYARWNSANVPNGIYNLTVRAQSSDGGSGTSTRVQVRVTNRASQTG
jgi:peptidoglycan/LPS O-acetylase OafA/YrhL